MRRVVVGAAVIRGGRLLAAQRAHPAELAGRWELPGGKVEAGESERQAVIRECHEELGCDVAVGDRLGPDLPTQDGHHVLRVWACTLIAGSAEPVAHEHRAIRWVGPDDLEALDWLAADRPLMSMLREHLRRPVR